MSPIVDDSKRALFGDVHFEHEARLPCDLCGEPTTQGKHKVEFADQTRRCYNPARKAPAPRGTGLARERARLHRDYPAVWGSET
jgi:hypothetical protein